MSLNPDYIFRMAKLIQAERLEEAESIRRWLGLRRPSFELPPNLPPPVAADREFGSRQKAS